MNEDLLDKYWESQWLIGHYHEQCNEAPNETCWIAADPSSGKVNVLEFNPVETPNERTAYAGWSVFEIHGLRKIYPSASSPD